MDNKPLLISENIFVYIPKDACLDQSYQKLGTNRTSGKFSKLQNIKIGILKLEYYNTKNIKEIRKVDW